MVRGRPAAARAAEAARAARTAARAFKPARERLVWRMLRARVRLPADARADGVGVVHRAQCQRQRPQRAEIVLGRSELLRAECECVRGRLRRAVLCGAEYAEPAAQSALTASVTLDAARRVALAARLRDTLLGLLCETRVRMQSPGSASLIGRLLAPELPLPPGTAAAAAWSCCRCLLELPLPLPPSQRLRRPEQLHLVDCGLLITRFALGAHRQAELRLAWQRACVPLAQSQLHSRRRRAADADDVGVREQELMRCVGARGRWRRPY